MTEPLRLRFQLGLGQAPVDLLHDAGLRRLDHLGDFRQLEDAAIGSVAIAVVFSTDPARARLPENLELIVQVMHGFLKEHEYSSIRVNRDDGDSLYFESDTNVSFVREFLTYRQGSFGATLVRPWPQKKAS